MIKKRTWPLLAIILTAILWGLSFLSIKVSVEVLQPMTLALVRFTIASLLLYGILRWREPDFKLHFKDIPLMAFGGIIGVTLYFYFENNGVKLTTASSSSIVIATIPIFSLIADAIFFANKLNATKAASVILSVLGVYFVVTGDINELTSGFGLGYMMMLGAALSWVGYSILTKPLYEKYSQLSITTYQTIFGTLALAPFALLEKVQWNLVSTGIVLNVLYLAIFCSALGYFLYVYAMEHLGISVTSLYINLIPVVAVAASYVVLHEEITIKQVIGGILVVVAVYISNKDESQNTCNNVTVEM